MKKGLFVLAPVLLTGMPASAAVVMRDYQTAGDQNLAYDSDLGLEFLKLPLTYQVGQADLSARFPGFRIARQSEIENFFGDLGLAGFRSGGFFPVAQGQAVMDAIGALVYRDFGRGSTMQASYAYFLTASGNYASFNINFNTGFVQPTGMSIIFQDWSLSNNPYMAQRATYLVREAAAATGVPEPSTWAMLIAGFGLIGAAMRFGRFGDPVSRRPIEG